MGTPCSSDSSCMVGVPPVSTPVETTSLGGLDLLVWLILVLSTAIVLISGCRLAIAHQRRDEPAGSFQLVLSGAVVLMMSSFILIQSISIDWSLVLMVLGWVLIILGSVGLVISLVCVGRWLPRYMAARRVAADKAKATALQEAKDKVLADLNTARVTLDQEFWPWLDEQAELAGLELTATGTYEGLAKTEAKA